MNGFDTKDQEENLNSPQNMQECETHSKDNTDGISADSAVLPVLEREKAIEEHDKRRKYVLGIATSGLFIALMIISAFISIPIGTLKITLQFLVTNVCFLLLGKKWGGISVLLYLLLGLFGLPIFSDGGGFAYVLKPSFGFLIGFLVGGFVAAWFREKVGKNNFVTYLIASLIDMLIMDIIGVAYGAGIMYGYMHLTTGAWDFLMAMLIPFIPLDLAKCAIGSAMCPKLSKYSKL